jgi:hypothetical protein
MAMALLEAHAPLEEIYDALGVPRDCLMQSDDLSLDEIQVGRICNWTSIVNVDVDPRLIVLLTNILRRQCPLRTDSPASRGVSGSFVCHHLFRPDVAGTTGVWSLVTLLDPYAAELLVSCDGVSSLTQLAERHPPS